MNKELVIFGASGALGSVAARYFLTKEYDNIFLVSSKPLDIQFSDNCKIIVAGDLSDEDEVKNVFKNFIPSKEKIFYLFSTIGGYTGGKPLWEESLNDFHTLLNKNLLANFLIIKHFALLAKECVGAAAVFTSAFSSLDYGEGSSLYGSSKAALNYLIKTVAIEGKKINLSVNAIAPYIIDTGKNREWFKGDYEELINPQETARFVEDIFNNAQILTGNIISMPIRIKNLAKSGISENK